MKKTYCLAGLILLAAVLVLSGCMTTFASESGQLAYGEIDGNVEGQISESETFMYIIHTELITLGDKYWENVDLMIEPALRQHGANAVTDLRINYGFTTMDYILSAFVPFVSWGTIEVEGTAVSQ